MHGQDEGEDSNSFRFYLWVLIISGPFFAELFDSFGHRILNYGTSIFPLSSQ